MIRDDLTAQVPGRATRPSLGEAERASPPRRAAYDADGFYAWDVHSNRGKGSCGVTGQCRLAQRRLADALIGIPYGDAQGSIRHVRLDREASQPSYIYGRVLLRARRDRRTGTIVFEGGA